VIEMSEDDFGTCELRDGETRDDTHTARNEATLKQAEGEDICPDCGGLLEGQNCPSCPVCGWEKCYGGKA